MKTRCWQCTVLLLVLACHRREYPDVVVIRASELVDGTGAAPRANVRITVRHGLIDTIDNDNELLSPPPGAQVIDARGLTVVPGFVATLSECAIEKLRDGVTVHAAMRLGTTTTEVVSTDPVRAGSLRTYTGVGRDRGPRIVVGAIVMPSATDLATSRAQVRGAADRGAELIHVPYIGTTQTTREALCALVDESHAQDMRTMIEVDNAERFEDARACVAETLVWRGAAPPKLEPEPLRELPEVVVNVAESQPAAALAWERAGALVAVTYGEPACVLSGVALGQIIERLVTAGMTRERAIATFTSGAARTLGLGEALGRVAPGYRADLVVAERGGLGDVRHVLIDGIEQRLEAPGLLQTWIAWWSTR